MLANFAFIRDYAGEFARRDDNDAHRLGDRNVAGLPRHLPGTSSTPTSLSACVVRAVSPMRFSPQ